MRCAVWHRAFDRARVHRGDRKLRQALRGRVGLRLAFLGQLDTGHPARQQRAGVRGDGVPDQHQTCRRLRRLALLIRLLRVRRRVVGHPEKNTGRVLCDPLDEPPRSAHAPRSAHRLVRLLGDEHRLHRRASRNGPHARARRRAGSATWRARATRGRTSRRDIRCVRALALLPRRVGAARSARARRRGGVRVLPRRLSPRPRPSAAVGMARFRLRPLATREQPRVPARARRLARRRPRRSARPTRRSAARSSSGSSTRSGTERTTEFPPLSADVGVRRRILRSAAHPLASRPWHAH